jgi:hypothetical protein
MEKPISEPLALFLAQSEYPEQSNKKIYNSSHHSKGQNTQLLHVLT